MGELRKKIGLCLLRENSLKIRVKSFAVSVTNSDWLLRNKELHRLSAAAPRWKNNGSVISQQGQPQIIQGPTASQRESNSGELGRLCPL